MTEYTCAVWYMRYFNAEYELCTTEEEAARYAVHLEENENGVVMGIQFADGRLVSRDEWAPYLRDMYQRIREEDAALRAAAPPPEPVRNAHDPFKGEDVEIPLGEPQWLGR